MSTVNDLFTSLSTIGALRNFHLHPFQSLLAYDSGLSVVLMDFNTDKKVVVHTHNSSISCVQFVGTNYEYILSIDSQLKPCLIITHWPSLTKVQQQYLPTIVKGSPVQKFYCNYYQPGFLVIAENYKERYAFSIWDLKSDFSSLLASHNEDILSQCNSINIFEPQQGRYSLFFAIIEKKMIKYWGYYKEKLELIHKIHVNDNILDSTISPLTQFLLFITEPGKLCIINKEGQFVSSVNHPMLTYSCLSLYNDYLFLGSTQGVVEIYQLSSLKFTKSLKNLRQSPKKTTFSNPFFSRRTRGSGTFQEDHKIGNIGFSTLHLFLTFAGSQRILVLMYDDSQMYFYDFEKGKHRGSITGHSEKIKEIVWEENSDQVMVSCSHDGTLRIWKFLGDGWTSLPIYPRSIFRFNQINDKARSLMQMAGKGDMSFRSGKNGQYRFTCMQVYWKENEIYAGDNRGSVCIYDIQSQNLKQEIHIGSIKVKNISIASDGSFVGVMLADGCSFVIQKYEKFSSQILLEQGSSVEKVDFYRGIKLLEADNSFNTNGDKFRSGVQKQSGYHSEFASSSTRPRDYGQQLGSVQQMAITTYNVNTLRLHQILKSQDKLNSFVAASYRINGKILDFEIHKSKDYLVVLSNQGNVCIFTLKSGELKIKIPVLKESLRMALDPAGLYVILVSPTVNIEAEIPTNSKSNRWVPPERTSGYGKSNYDTQETTTISDQSTLSLYELWTGEYLGEVKKIQKASCLSFSGDGRYLAVGSHNGSVTVMGVDEGVQANIEDVLNKLKINPLFWSNFYIETIEDQENKFPEEPKEPGDEDNSIYQEVLARENTEKSLSYRSIDVNQQPLNTISLKSLAGVKDIGTGMSSVNVISAILSNKEVQVSRPNIGTSGNQPQSYRDQPSIDAGQNVRSESNLNSRSSINKPYSKEIQESARIPHARAPSGGMSLYGQEQGQAKQSEQFSPNFKTTSQQGTEVTDFAQENARYQNREIQTTLHNISASSYKKQFENLKKKVDVGIGSAKIDDTRFYEETGPARYLDQQFYRTNKEIQPDPSDIDEEENYKRNEEKKQGYPQNYERRHPESPVRFQELQANFERHLKSNTEPSKEKYPWEQDTVMSLGQHYSEEISNMYNDIDEFEKRFIRNPANPGNHK